MLYANEPETRYNHIDPQISKAGWGLHDRSQVDFELPVAGYLSGVGSGFTEQPHRRAVPCVIQKDFMERRAVQIADLYEAPFTNFGSNAVEKLFTRNDVEEILELVRGLGA